MGSWVEKYFGRDILPKYAIIIPGTTGNEQKHNYLALFDKIISCESNLFEWYILDKGGIQYLLVLQVYGAPMVIDLIHILKEGQTQSIIFMGAAYGFGNEVNTGDIILPNQVQALEGVLTTYENTLYSYPNEDLLQQLAHAFDKENLKYKKGKTVSTPSVFTEVDGSLFDSDVLALEMEASAFLYFTQKESIEGASILVISDTEYHKLTDTQTNRYLSMLRIMNIIFKDNTVFIDDSKMKQDYDNFVNNLSREV